MFQRDQSFRTTPSWGCSLTYDFRELEPDEFGLVPAEATGGLALPTDDRCRVFAALDGGKVVAIWCIIPVVHCEPLWIDEAHRGSGNGSSAILGGLWGKMSDALRELDVKIALSMVRDDRPSTRRIAERLGAAEFPGKLFVLSIDGRS